VISRDALRQHIWSDGTFVDFERGLNFCIAQIRSALGDSADAPRYIETLPRRGYRFIAPVRHAPPSSAAKVPPLVDHDASAPQVVTPLVHTRRRRLFLATAGLIVVLTGAAVWWASSPTRTIRIAVVPFDNETGEDSFDRVAIGVADETVARLASRDGRLEIIGNSAALRRPRAFRDLKAIARDVGADYIVLAQMKADAEGVRLIAHLIRAADEAHVWAATFDRRTFTLDAQTEIAKAIAEAVSARVGRL